MTSPVTRTPLAALKAALKEPLVQFALIGIVLFAADRATRPEEVDPRQIHVDATVHRELSDIFFESRNRRPTSAEMDRLVEQHVVNETLFREARNLRLDEGDEMIRERLMQRMRLMMYSGIQVEAPPEDVLRAWFEDNRARYATPERLTFRIVGLDGSETEARALAERLEAGADPQEAAPRGAVAITFRQRPREQMADLFGEAFLGAIEDGPEDTWRALASPQGWQVVRLVQRLPAKQPGFEEARTGIPAQWKAEEVQRRAVEALDALRERYPVVYEPYSAEVVETAGERGEPVRAEAEGGEQMR